MESEENVMSLEKWQRNYYRTLKKKKDDLCYLVAKLLPSITCKIKNVPNECVVLGKMFFRQDVQNVSFSFLLVQNDTTK